MCFLSLSATEKKPYPKDTLAIESVAFDKELYDNFKSQKRFDYSQQAEPEKMGWWEELQMKFYRWLSKNISPNLSKKQSDNIVIIGVIVFLFLIILFLYIYRPSLFYLNRKQKLDYQIEEEELENQNLDVLIKKALEQEQFAEALRWKYMKVLKILNEKDFISFDAHKTVNEYVYEISRKDLRAYFRNLSVQFTYYRYGNGVATQAVFDTFNEVSNQFLKML